MLRTMDPNLDGGIISPPLASNPTTKSFLHRIATQNKKPKFHEKLEKQESEPLTNRQEKEKFKNYT